MKNMTDIDKFIKLLRKEVQSTLSYKTNWGRNQLQLELEKAYVSALLKYTQS